MANEKDTTAQAKEAAARGTGAAKDAADEMTNAARKVASEAAEAGSRGAKAGADVSRDLAQTAGRTVEDQAQRLSQIFGVQAKVSEDVANRTSQTLDVMMQCGTVLADGWQVIMKEWMHYAQGAMQRNVDGVQEMMRARTVQDLLAAQSERLRDEMELLMNSSVRVSELSARITSDAYQRLHERAEQQRKEAA